VGVLGINHIAFGTPDPEALKAFYAELLAVEELAGEHDPLRAGHTLLVFFRDEARVEPASVDEIAFDVDAAGFGEVLERAQRMRVMTKPPVDHTPWSKGFYVQDPEGRRIEITYDDRGVYWQE
jgi:catechol 2,3-dioxygenase-like lactoylglutathione lyase family enzyme